jgi:general secretion pathway protein I
MRCTWRADRPTFPEAKFGDLNLGAGLDLAGAGGPAGAGNGGNPLGALGLLAGAGGPSPLASASSVSDVAKTLADANALAATPGGSPSPVPSPSPSGQPLDPNADPSAAGGGMGGLASMAMSFVYPSLKALFEASTRRITATLTFREGKKEYSIDVIEWFAVPQKGLAAADDGDAGVATNPAAAPTGTGATTGTPAGGNRTGLGTPAGGNKMGPSAPGGF